MPFNSATAAFSRVWRFVDRFLPGQDITRADLDLMADDLTEGINAALRNNLNFVGDWIAGSAFPTTRPDGSPIRARDTWRVSTGGTVGGVTFVVDDYLTALVPTPGTLYANNWLKIPALLIPSVLTLVDQAELARDEAQAALDSFDDRYLGAKAVAPTLDNDGNALIDGALYWDTAVKRFQVYDLGTTSWVDIFLIGSNVQAFSSLLTAIAGLASNGFLAKTGATTAAARTITAGAGIAVSNGDGVSGNPVISSTLAGRNRIINGQGRINQRGYVSGTATTGANQYTLDRWRVVVSGQSLTFTGDDSKRTMTAPAGGVEQVIEAANIEGGTYVLNWTGTATATVGGVARAKGETFTLAANTNATVRFSSGTFTDVQLEAGSTPTTFERLPLKDELALCQRYYWKTYSQGVTPGTVTTAGAVGAINVATGSTYGALTSVYFPVDMRVAPSLTYFNPITGVAGSWRADATDYGVGNAGIGISTRSTVIGNASASIPAVAILLYGHIVADAEI